MALLNAEGKFDFKQTKGRTRGEEKEIGTGRVLTNETQPIKMRITINKSIGNIYGVSGTEAAPSLYSI